ncbi:MAG TPA: NUDIX hydrolase [bacterium]|nr:NUDIX hydrolase [bacterium]
MRLDEVAYPSGRRKVLEVVEHPGAVAMVALTADRDVLLVRQFRHAVAAELLEVPAGTLEPGETPLECARRELAEEVGRAAGRWDPLISFYPSPGVLSEEIHVFLAEDLRPEAAAREEEDLRVESLPLEEAYRRIDAGEIRDAKTIIGITMARERLAHRG